MKKAFIFLSLLISLAYLSYAVSINLNSGNKLESSNWNSLSSVLNKVDVSGENLKVNGKFVISGKIIDSYGKVLGECDAENHWDTNINNCASNTKACSKENATSATQTWNGTDYGECTVITCDSGYVKNGNSCIATATTPESAGLSCKDLYDNKGVKKDGTYYIMPNGVPFQVYCNMTFKGGGWTLVHVSQILQKGWGFKGGGSCKQLNQNCNYKVKNTLVDNSNEVLFYTDNNYWSRLNYSKTGRWAIAMKDAAGRSASSGGAGLTFIEDGPSVSRSEYWNQFWDNSAGMIFSNGSHYGVLGLSYGVTTNGWMPNNTSGGNRHTTNVFIR